MTIFSEKITGIFNTILSILVLVGVVVDPTTAGTMDSRQALGYKMPRGDRENK